MPRDVTESEHSQMISAMQSQQPSQHSKHRKHAIKPRKQSYTPKSAHGTTERTGAFLTLPAPPPLNRSGDFFWLRHSCLLAGFGALGSITAVPQRRGGGRSDRRRLWVLVNVPISVESPGWTVKGLGSVEVAPATIMVAKLGGDGRSGE